MDKWKEYLDSLDELKQNMVLEVMSMAAIVIPNPERVMSYGVPTIKSGGRPIIAVAANKNHFSVYPFGGAAIEANLSLLKDLDYSKGTIRFPYDNLPEKKLIEAIVKYNLSK